MQKEIINIIREVAQIPSFSSYEERIHPYIFQFIKDNNIDCELHQLDNSLVIEINKKQANTPIAFTAHLDKINHFDEELETLNFAIDGEQLVGQLDNAVGVGICLYLLKNSTKFNLPHSLFLFSEMEESFGMRFHPHKLKNKGEGLESQIGAKRISAFLIEKQIIPSIFITIDTTPLFKGKPGVALYSKFWEMVEITPSEEIKEKTKQVEKLILDIDSDILLANNTNDYMIYGKLFHEAGHMAPSVAFEPSIQPYHTINERVYTADVIRIIKVIKAFVEKFTDKK